MEVYVKEYKHREDKYDDIIASARDNDGILVCGCKADLELEDYYIRDRAHKLHWLEPNLACYEDFVAGNLPSDIPVYILNVVHLLSYIERKNYKSESITAVGLEFDRKYDYIKMELS